MTLVIHGIWFWTQKMNLNDFGDPLNFHLVPPAGSRQNYHAAIGADILDLCDFFVIPEFSSNAITRSQF